MIFDLIAGTNAGGGTAAWTPAELFQNGELGFWFDASDLSTLFQDAAGTTPVAASGQPVGLWKNKIAGQTGFDVSQSTTAARPVLSTTSGKSSVGFDGVDDRLFRSPSTLTSNNGVTLSVGYHPLSEPSTLRNVISFYSFGSRIDTNSIPGQLVSASFYGSNAQSSTGVIAGSPNILTVTSLQNTTPTVLRVNGSASSASSPGTSDLAFSSIEFPHNSLGSKFSQIVFINRQLNSTEITQLEAFIGSKQ